MDFLRVCEAMTATSGVLSIREQRFRMPLHVRRRPNGYWRLWNWAKISFFFTWRIFFCVKRTAISKPAIQSFCNKFFPRSGWERTLYEKATLMREPGKMAYKGDGNTTLLAWKNISCLQSFLAFSVINKQHRQQIDQQRHHHCSFPQFSVAVRY